MGRPRSVRAHDQVLEAAVRLFSERGIDSTSVDSIAEASGVSKATIYKHWPDKDALCLEAVARAHALDKAPVPETGDLQTDIATVLGRGAPAPRTELQNRLMPHLISYAAKNPAFERAWKARIFDPPRSRLKELLKQAIEDGVFPADLNLQMAMAMLLGPMMYRRIAHQTLPEDMADRVVAAFWKAHAIPGARRRATTISAAADPRHPRSYRPAGSTSATDLGSRTPRGG